MGTAYRPASSTTTTAGSVLLCPRQGAMARTAMPAAPTKTRASDRPKARAAHASTRRPSRVQAAGQPALVSASASRSAKAFPGQ